MISNVDRIRDFFLQHEGIYYTAQRVADEFQVERDQVYNFCWRSICCGLMESKVQPKMGRTRGQSYRWKPREMRQAS